MVAPPATPDPVVDARRILVRAPNWAGDVVMATPALRALRAGFPEARITVQVRAALAPLLAGAPWADEVVPVESHRRGLRTTWNEGRRLRPRDFDLGLCLPDSFSSALLMRAAGVRHVVGYRRGARRPLLHRAVGPPRAEDGTRWVARERHVLGLVAALGVPAGDTRLELFVTEDEAREGEAMLAARGVAPDAPLVALAPGASYGPSKCWPPEHFAAAADRLAERGLRPVLVGAPSERALADAIRRHASQPPCDLVGAIGLGALKAVVRRARLLVCNDAGARHVAVAFGVPVVCCMGPTSLAKTNLNLERVRVLTADVACRPCYHRRCPTDHRCMTRIAPEHVVEAADRAVAAAP